MRQCTASSAMTAIGSVISPTVQARPAGTRNQCDGVSTISNYGLYLPAVCFTRTDEVGGIHPRSDDDSPASEGNECPDSNLR